MRRIIIISLFALLVFLFSCDKEDPDNKDQLVRIETETIFEAEELLNHSLYTHDEQGRLIESSHIAFYMTGYYFSRYIFGADQVIKYEYVSGNDTPWVTYNYLNVSGWVDSSHTLYNGVVESTAKFEYNDDGYLVKSEQRYELEKMYFFASYEIENGNRKKRISRDIYREPEVVSVRTRNAEDPMSGFLRAQTLCLADGNTLKNETSNLYDEVDTVYYEYNDHANTISMVNRGMTWMGLPDKNLVSKENRFLGGKNISYEYGYDYDDQGRVTKKYPSDGQGISYSYTYTD